MQRKSYDKLPSAIMIPLLIYWIFCFERHFDQKLLTVSLAEFRTDQRRHKKSFIKNVKKTIPVHATSSTFLVCTLFLNDLMLEQISDGLINVNGFMF